VRGCERTGSLTFVYERNTLLMFSILRCSGVASYGALGHVPPSTSNNFIFISIWSKSDSQLSDCCVICKISCQQLIALSPLVTKLFVIEQLRAHLALKFAVSASFAPPRNKFWRRHCFDAISVPSVPQFLYKRPPLLF